MAGVDRSCHRVHHNVDSTSLAVLQQSVPRFARVDSAPPYWHHGDASTQCSRHTADVDTHFVLSCHCCQCVHIIPPVVVDRLTPPPSPMRHGAAMPRRSIIRDDSPPRRRKVVIDCRPRRTSHDLADHLADAPVATRRPSASLRSRLGARHSVNAVDVSQSTATVTSILRTPQTPRRKTHAALHVTHAIVETATSITDDSHGSPSTSASTPPVDSLVFLRKGRAYADLSPTQTNNLRVSLKSIQNAGVGFVTKRVLSTLEQRCPAVKVGDDESHSVISRHLGDLLQGGIRVLPDGKRPPAHVDHQRSRAHAAATAAQRVHRPVTNCEIRHVPCKPAISYLPRV